LAFLTYLVTPRGRGNFCNHSRSRIRFFSSNSFKRARCFFPQPSNVKKIAFTSSFFSFSNRLDKISIERFSDSIPKRCFRVFPLPKIAGCKNQTLVCKVWICSLYFFSKTREHIFYSGVRNIFCGLLIKT
jgi:hypothetical protein